MDGMERREFPPKGQLGKNKYGFDDSSPGDLRFSSLWMPGKGVCTCPKHKKSHTCI
jgi:hypothetical protein